MLVSFALPDRYARTETVLPLALLGQMAILRVMAVDQAVMVVHPAEALVTAAPMEVTVEATAEAAADPVVVPTATTEVTMEVPMGEATVPLLAMAQAMEATAMATEATETEAPVAVVMVMEAQVVAPMGDHQAAMAVLLGVALVTGQTAATRKETVADLALILVVMALLLATVVEMVAQL